MRAQRDGDEERKIKVKRHAKREENRVEILKVSVKRLGSVEGK